MKKIDILQDFERYLHNEDRSERTIATYVSTVKLIRKYMAEQFEVDFDENMKGYMVSQWATSIRNLKPTSRALYIVIAGVFFRYLYNMDYVSKDLSSALPKPPKVNSGESEKRAYTLEEIRTMMNATTRKAFPTARNRAIIATLVSTGLRASELAQLNVGDVYNGKAQVVRKGGAKKEIFLSEELKPYIKSYLEMREDNWNDDSPLFVSATAKRMNGHDLYMALSAVEKQCGFPTGVHTFRHTALSALAKSANPVVARDVAGHKSFRITNRYSHSTEEEVRAATDEMAGYFLG